MNRQALFAILFGAGLMTGLFYLMRPEPEPPAAPAPPAAGSEVPPPPGALPGEPGPVPEGSLELPAPPAMTVDWTVRGGKLTAGPARVVLKAGDDVVLNVLSDRDDELHLHGYDLSMDLKAGQSARLSFRAEHSGRFEAELHRSHLQLGTLEVLPR